MVAPAAPDIERHVKSTTAMTSTVEPRVDESTGDELCKDSQSYRDDSPRICSGVNVNSCATEGPRQLHNSIPVRHAVTAQAVSNHDEHGSHSGLGHSGDDEGRSKWSDPDTENNRGWSGLKANSLMIGVSPRQCGCGENEPVGQHSRGNVCRGS